MIANGQTLGIPPAQMGAFLCTTCNQPGVFQVATCVQFVFDKLNPDEMKPASVTMYQCIKCKGYLVKQKDKSFKVVAMTEAT